jgi:type I restriction enzyme S subunit
MTMALVELGDLAFRGGGSVDPKKHPDEVFELFSIPAFDAGVPEIVTGSKIGSSKKAVRPDDVMVSRIVPHIRRAWVVGADRGHRQIASGEWIIFRSTEVWPAYLRWVLVGDAFHAAFMQTVSGVGGSLLRARPAEVFKIRIPLPPLPEQKRIAAILDAADALRAKRRESIEQLDSLIQVRFLEMFGDPVTNPRGFPVRSLPDFYVNAKEGTKCGPFGSALKKHELADEGVPVWNMDNISTSGRMLLPFRMWITPKKFRDLEAYAVLDGDVLISRAGTVGKMCVATSGVAESVLSTNLIRVRFGKSLLPIYFVSLMTYCKGRVGRLKVGPDGAFTHMSTGVLDTLRFPYPPLDLQREFASIVESIEHQKARLKAHLAELDTLFASLQSRAFNGELLA